MLPHNGLGAAHHDHGPSLQLQVTRPTRLFRIFSAFS